MFDYYEYKGLIVLQVFSPLGSYNLLASGAVRQTVHIVL